MIRTFLPVHKLVRKFLVFDSPKVSWERLPLNWLLNAMDVVSLKESSFGSVNVFWVETINSTLVRRIFVSEFFIDTDKFL